VRCPRAASLGAVRIRPRPERARRTDRPPTTDDNRTSVPWRSSSCPQRRHMHASTRSQDPGLGRGRRHPNRMTRRRQATSATSVITNSVGPPSTDARGRNHPPHVAREARGERDHRPARHGRSRPIRVMPADMAPWSDEVRRCLALLFHRFGAGGVGKDAKVAFPWGSIGGVQSSQDPHGKALVR
jgi:hypothetical protein